MRSVSIHHSLVLFVPVQLQSNKCLHLPATVAVSSASSSSSSWISREQNDRTMPCHSITRWVESGSVMCANTSSFILWLSFMSPAALLWTMDRRDDIIMITKPDKIVLVLLILIDDVQSGSGWFHEPLYNNWTKSGKLNVKCISWNYWKGCEHYWNAQVFANNSSPVANKIKKRRQVEEGWRWRWQKQFLSPFSISLSLPAQSFARTQLLQVW